MSGEVKMSLSTEALDSGSAEERATFGLFSMTANERLLTEGVDTVEPEAEPRPVCFRLSARRVDRLELLAAPLGVRSPHCRGRRMSLGISPTGCPPSETVIGWPDLTIFSDGLQCFLVSAPSRSPDSLLFRYLGASRRPEVVPAKNLEEAIDGFVDEILIRLEDRKLSDTNLHRLWKDLAMERTTPELARFRRLEAQLGCDPDEAGEHVIRRHLAATATLGEDAMGELATDSAIHGSGPDGMMSADTIENFAVRSGFDANPNDAVALDDAEDVPRMGETVAAWRVGVRAARALRTQERMDGEPICDTRLADFAGTTVGAISDTNRCSERISFLLHQESENIRLSLRSKWETGRRFDLARLIGDRLLRHRACLPAERLHPATRARSSYRQKMQRAFAAELLCPFASMDDMLRGDYSEESQSAVAEHFNVSPWTIGTQLVNLYENRGHLNAAGSSAPHGDLPGHRRRTSKAVEPEAFQARSGRAAAASGRPLRRHLLPRLRQIRPWRDHP